jgi:hypothetical protein
VAIEGGRLAQVARPSDVGVGHGQYACALSTSKL